MILSKDSKFVVTPGIIRVSGSGQRSSLIDYKGIVTLKDRITERYILWIPEYDKTSFGVFIR